MPDGASPRFTPPDFLNVRLSCPDRRTRIDPLLSPTLAAGLTRQPAKEKPQEA